MSVSSKQPAPATINGWLRHVAEQFERATIPSARLDAELLLCHMLGVDRTWLIAHGDDSLARSALSQKGGVRRGGLKEYGEQLILKRLKRVPIAYLIGRKEFYGREFIVTPDVLIPRPETETMITLLSPMAETASTLIDVGTGSGAIAVTAKLTYPNLTVEATDISEDALNIAAQNAKTHGAAVKFYVSDLLANVGEHYDFICANLPYVDRRWEVSTETRAEPDLALYADDGGLSLIRTMLPQASAKQRKGNYVLLEADPRQHDSIVSSAKTHGYSWHRTEGFIVVLKKTA